MKYELEHPRVIKITIGQWKEDTYKKIGDIGITRSTIYWKSGKKGAYKKHYVYMDGFIEWMNDQPTR
jgi:hypothetical protein